VRHTIPVHITCPLLFLLSVLFPLVDIALYEILILPKYIFGDSHSHQLPEELLEFRIGVVQ